MAGCCEHGDEHAGFIMCGECLDSPIYFLKQYSVPGSSVGYSGGGLLLGDVPGLHPVRLLMASCPTYKPVCYCSTLFLCHDGLLPLPSQSTAHK